MSADFEAIGIDSAIEMFEGIVVRLQDPAKAQEPVNQALDAAYHERWNRWRGFLVDTGALRESWTQDDATGALRQAHADMIEFGTELDYSVFHSKPLLRVTPKMNEALSDALADYFVPERDDNPLAVHQPPTLRLGRGA